MKKMEINKSELEEVANGVNAVAILTKVLRYAVILQDYTDLKLDEIDISETLNIIEKLASKEANSLYERL